LVHGHAATKRDHVPQIYFFGGLPYVVMFGILMITAFPPAKSIVPPLMIALGIIEMIGSTVSVPRARNSATRIGAR
jgi:hypothetical protein